MTRMRCYCGGHKFSTSLINVAKLKNGHISSQSVVVCTKCSRVYTMDVWLEMEGKRAEEYIKAHPAEMDGEDL